MEAGARLGRYTVLGPLGVAAAAQLYRAHDSVLRREITLAVPLGGAEASEQEQARFETEMRATSLVSHRSVAAVHDVGNDGNTSFAVLELLEGETLAQRLRRGSMPRQEALAIAAAVARALEAAHRTGMVHHGLGPDVVFLQGTGGVRLLGFGGRHGGDRGASDGERYTSPELARGDLTDGRADVYSLGRLLQEMIHGPADNGDHAASVDRPAEQLQLPGSLCNLLEVCLEPAPERRWDMCSLAQALEGLGDDAGDLDTSTMTSVMPVRPRRRALVVVGVVVVMALAYLATRLVGDEDASQGVGPRSLAVLPLESFSAQDDHFADGMTEALITELAGVKQLHVISRTSVMRYKGTQMTISAIARELGAELVIEGSVMRSGQRVRIIVQLIHASRDDHMWAQSFEGDTSDILNLQREVAAAVTREVAVATGGQASPSTYRARAVVPEAHEAYLRGRYLLSQDTAQALAGSIEQFQEAIVRDPDHALAHVGLAEALIRLVNYGTLAPAEGYERARVAARRALELEPVLADAHVIMGAIATEYDWDWETAERQYLRALELGPSLARAHERYAVHLAARERFDEALGHGRRALELDPMSPRLRYALAAIHLAAGDVEAAKEHSRQALLLAPGFGAAEGALGLCYEQEGRLTEAIAQFKKAGALLGTLGVAPELGHAYARAGRADDAFAVIAEVEAFPDVEPGMVAFTRAMVHLGLGEHDRAVALLEQAQEHHFVWVMLLRVDPRLRPLRDHPRFRALLARVGLADG